MLAESRTSGEVRAVRESTGEDHAAQIVLSPHDDRDLDVGLLYVMDYLGKPVELSGQIAPGAAKLRGAPSGVSTEQASFVGEILGQEWDRRNGLVVDVVLRELGWLERPSTSRATLLGNEDASSLAYAALRGLSGAPVIRDDAGVQRVVAMIVRRNTAGLANRVYGIPALALTEQLSARGYQLHIVTQDAGYHESNSAIALTGRLIQRLLRAPEGAVQLWDDVSELFYMGVPVDNFFSEALRDPRRYHFEPGGSQQSHIEFLLARLLFKRGQSVKARTLLRHVARRARQDQSPEHLELGALVNLRLTLEDGGATGNVELRREQFKRAVGQYESVGPSSDGDRAYELASALGREASLLPVSGAASSEADPVMQYFTWLTSQQSQLVQRYPERLISKQEVVQIALELIATMYGADGSAGSERIARMRSHVSRGMAAAVQRENAVFAAQMNLAAAALAHDRGDHREAYRVACSTAGALRRNGLRLDHEGVSLVIGYLDATEPAIASIVHAVFEQGVGQGLLRIEASGAPSARGIDINALRTAAAEASEWLSEMRNLLDIFVLDAQL